MENDDDDVIGRQWFDGRTPNVTLPFGRQLKPSVPFLFSSSLSELFAPSVIWMFLIFFLISITTCSAFPRDPNVDDIERRNIIGIPFTGNSITNTDQWICGPGFFTELLSHSVVSQACDEKTTELNMCCAMHDSCYDTRGGRERCDNHFCNCLDNVMADTSDLPFGCGKSYTNIACGLVKKFGGKSYGSPKPDNMKLRAFHPAMNKTVVTRYNALYKGCPGFRKPLTTCAYNHIVCHLQMRPTSRYRQEYADCRQELKDCLNGFAGFLVKREGDEWCREHIDEIVKVINGDAEESGMPQDVWFVEKEETTTDEKNSNSTDSPGVTENTTGSDPESSTETNDSSTGTDSTERSTDGYELVMIDQWKD